MDTFGTIVTAVFVSAVITAIAFGELVIKETGYVTELHNSQKTQIKSLESRIVQLESSLKK